MSFVAWNDASDVGRPASPPKKSKRGDFYTVTEVEEILPRKSALASKSSTTEESLTHKEPAKKRVSFSNETEEFSEKHNFVRRIRTIAASTKKKFISNTKWWPMSKSEKSEDFMETVPSPPASTPRSPSDLQQDSGSAIDDFVEMFAQKHKNEKFRDEEGSFTEGKLQMETDKRKKDRKKTKNKRKPPLSSPRTNYDESLHAPRVNYKEFENPIVSVAASLEQTCGDDNRQQGPRLEVDRKVGQQGNMKSPQQCSNSSERPITPLLKYRAVLDLPKRKESPLSADKEDSQQGKEKEDDNFLDGYTENLISKMEGFRDEFEAEMAYRFPTLFKAALTLQELKEDASCHNANASTFPNAGLHKPLFDTSCLENTTKVVPKGPRLITVRPYSSDKHLDQASVKRGGQSITTKITSSSRGKKEEYSDDFIDDFDQLLDDVSL